MNLIPIELQGPDQWFGYFIGLILSVIVQGEGQDFFILMFQPLKDREDIVYDLNPLHHLDPRGLPLLLLTGWGWSKKKISRPSYFPEGWPYKFLIPLAGTMCVMCLAGLLGTLYFLLQLGFIRSAVEASAMMAMANFLIPIPPLALGRALCAPFDSAQRNARFLESAGTGVLTAMILTAYFMNWPFLRDWVVSMGMVLSRWILSL